MQTLLPKPWSHKLMGTRGLPGVRRFTKWLPCPVAMLSPGLRKSFEVDALGERQLGRVVERVGGPAHVCLPGV
jgi:hypothetical protein